MAARSVKPRKRRVDPNQLNLLDYRPPTKRAAATGNRKSSARGAAPAPEQATLFNILTAKEAAIYLRVSLATLKSWRAKECGPNHVKRGARLIGYKPADLDAYMNGQTQK